MKVILWSVLLCAVSNMALAQSFDDATSILKQVTSPTASAQPPAKVTNPSIISPSITSTDANSGLKLALSKAVDLVVNQLSRPGGFANDPKVRIGLPGPLAALGGDGSGGGLLGSLGGVVSALDKTGLTKGVTSKLNSAAELAVGKAGPLLKGAIKKMSVSDALGIVSGSETSATDYFKRTMGADLQGQMAPVVTTQLRGVKAFDAVNGLIAKSPLPLGAFGAKDLTSYVTQKASDGVFYYMGEQEKKIRANPVAFGSALLTKIFGVK